MRCLGKRVRKTIAVAAYTQVKLPLPDGICRARKHTEAEHTVGLRYGQLYIVSQKWEAHDRA